MLSRVIGEQNVHRSSWRVRHTIRDSSVAGRRNIGPANSHVSRLQERIGQVGQPIRIRIRVVIQIGDDLTLCRVHAEITGGAQTAVWRADYPKSVWRHHRLQGWRRTVVNDDHFEIWIPKLRYAIETLPQGPMPIVAANHNGNARPVPCGAERSLGKRPVNNLQRDLFCPIPPREAKVPILNIEAASIPFVCPPEYKYSCATTGEGRPDQPIQGLGLALFPITPAVETNLGQDQRAFSRQIVESRQVSFPGILRLQIHVKAHQVQEWQSKVLGCGIVYVSNQRVGILTFYYPV